MFAAAGKATDPAGFGAALESHGLFPPQIIHEVGWMVPAVEGSLGGLAVLAACLNRLVHPLLFGVALLFLMFTAYAISMHMFPPAQPTRCGCGVFASHVTDWGWLAVADGGIAVWMAMLAWACAPRVGSRQQ
jgi:hypothetical protein